MPRDPSADIWPLSCAQSSVLHAGHRGGCGLPMMLTTGLKEHLVWARDLCAGVGSAQPNSAAPSLPPSRGDLQRLCGSHAWCA